MQRNKLDTRALPTNPALADLLPGGALAAGSAYSVIDSTTLALSLLQGPSAAGAWCAVVGMPDLGVEAAAGLGIDLERLVLVPHPGEQWLSVVSALVDVVSIMLVRPPVRDGRVRITDGSASKLASRLRQREAVLVSLGDWPGAQRPPRPHRQQLGGSRRRLRAPHRPSGHRQLDGRRMAGPRQVTPALAARSRSDGRGGHDPQRGADAAERGLNRARTSAAPAAGRSTARRRTPG